MDNEKILAAIAELEKKMEGLKDDKRVAELEKQIAALQDEFRRNSQKSAEPAGGKPVETFGTEFVKSEAYKNFSDGVTRKAVYRQKNTVTAPTVTVHKDGIRAPEVRTEVEDYIPTTPTSGNLIEFVRESSWTNNAAAVLEAGEKPESAITFTPQQMPVQTIAHIIRVTRQLAADAPALAAYIDLRMARGVASATETELVAGNGTAPHLSGLLHTGNYTPHGMSQGTGETNLDLIRKCALAIRTAGYRANAVLLNPSDYDTFLGMKDSSGKYLISDPVADRAPRLWGLDVIQSTAVTAGNFLVGDFNMANIWNREGTVVEMFEQDEDNVSKNLITIRAERRIALTIESALAFVGGALWS